MGVTFEAERALRNFRPGANLTAHNGLHAMADYDTGWLKVLDIDSPTVVSEFATGASNPVDIKFAADGTL